MTFATRRAVFLAAGAVVAALVVWAVTGLPAFGTFQGGIGNQLVREAPPERGTSNVVTAIVFDYRGFDTLGEEFILFTAVCGVALLLRRHEREDAPEARDEVTSDPVRAAGALMAAPLFLLGLWLVTYGYVTPGGGFQGGVLLAGSVLLVWLARSYRRYRELTPKPIVDAFEGAGAGAYAVVGLVGLVVEGAYLQNFLGSGTTGTLNAAGSIGLVNWATAVEVTAAMLLLFSEFLEEYVAPVRT